MQIKISEIRLIKWVYDYSEDTFHLKKSTKKEKISGIKLFNINLSYIHVQHI